MMHPINLALVYVEQHLDQNIKLADIAQASGISQFHLSRVFAYTTGYSLGKYLRLRRLSEAARLLLQTEENILDIALRVGYDSHSVFSRAFKAEFGIRPSELRGELPTKKLGLVSPSVWSASMNIAVPIPREEQDLTLHMVGLSQSFRDHINPTEVIIQELLPELFPKLEVLENVTSPGYVQSIANFQSEKTFDWFSGVTVSSKENIPNGLEYMELHCEKYLAFPFSLQGKKVEDFILAIYTEWLPNSSYHMADGHHLEWYREDPGGVPLSLEASLAPETKLEGEIWIPIL